jgi:hypothetical protein
MSKQHPKENCIEDYEDDQDTASLPDVEALHYCVVAIVVIDRKKIFCSGRYFWGR